MSPAFGSLVGVLLRPCPGRLRVPSHILAPQILQLSQQPQHGCPASFSERALSELGGEWGAISRSLGLLPASLQPFHLLRMGVQWKGWFSNCALEPKGLQVCGARCGETGRGQRHPPPRLAGGTGLVSMWLLHCLTSGNLPWQVWPWALRDCGKGYSPHRALRKRGQTKGWSKPVRPSHALWYLRPQPQAGWHRPPAGRPGTDRAERGAPAYHALQDADGH